MTDISDDDIAAITALPRSDIIALRERLEFLAYDLKRYNLREEYLSKRPEI